MNIQNRRKPTEAAKQFIQEVFPECQGALLAGSAARNELTETSDLDIIIFDETIPASYRESRIGFGWPIEVFVHNFTSYKTIFESDYRRARPSMQRMVSEGLILKDDRRIAEIKCEAERVLADGPKKWSPQTIEMKRYFITDTLEDLIAAKRPQEELFIVNTLSDLLQEFLLRVNRQWLGSSKWVYRELERFDHQLAHRYYEVLDTYYTTRDKTGLIKFADDVLQPFGGRKFDGFSIGKITWSR